MNGPSDGWVRGRDYRRGNRLGSGGYGVVFECINMNPTVRKEGIKLNRGALFAEKVVELACDRGSINELRNEVEVLSSLQHPHIVRYYGSYISGKERCRLHLFMEYVPGGSLHDIVVQFGRLSEAVIQTYTEQILQALQYLHSEGYVHRDLKASNILINTSSVVKVGDFGTCHRMENLRNQNHEIELSQVGTPSFFPPERILEKKIGPQTDIWALGCVILEMINGYRPFRHAENVYQVGYRLSSGELPSEEVPGTASNELRKFVKLCCERDLDRRPLSNTLLNDQFIKMEIGSESTSDFGYGSDGTDDRMSLEMTETMTISTLNYYNSTIAATSTAEYGQQQIVQQVPLVAAASRQPAHGHRSVRKRKYIPSMQACFSGCAIAAGASVLQSIGYAKNLISKYSTTPKGMAAISDGAVSLQHGHTSQSALIRGCVWLVGITTPPAELTTFLQRARERHSEYHERHHNGSMFYYFMRKKGTKSFRKFMMFTFCTALLTLMYELVLLIREKRKLIQQEGAYSPRCRPSANIRIIQRYLRCKTGGKLTEG